MMKRKTTKNLLFLTPFLLLGACTQKENPQNLAVNEPGDTSEPATVAKEPPPPPATAPAPEPEPAPLPPAPKKVSDLLYKDGRYYAKGTSEPISGEFEAKYDSGQVQAVSHFEGGLKEGVEKSWNEDGSLRLETNYKKGKTHGLSRNWHDNGQLMSETFYANGLVNGVSKTWHSNGEPDTETPYNFGKIEGTSKSWYKDGTKYTETNYRNNRKHGMDFRWDKEGKLVHQARYHDGTLAETLVEPPVLEEYPTPVDPEPAPLEPSPPTQEPEPEPEPDSFVNFVASGDVQVVAKDAVTGKVVLAKKFSEGESVQVDAGRKLHLLLSNGSKLNLEREGRVTGTGGGSNIQQLELSLGEGGVVQLDEAQ